MYNEKIQTVSVSGLAETKEGAIGKALAGIQKKVKEQVNSNCVIFRIEPLDMEVLSARESSYTERFLGLLFPRIRTQYKLELSVKVRLVFIDVEKIPFEKQTKSRSTIQRFLQQH